VNGGAIDDAVEKPLQENEPHPIFTSDRGCRSPAWLLWVRRAVEGESWPVSPSLKTICAASRYSGSTNLVVGNG